MFVMFIILVLIKHGRAMRVSCLKVFVIFTILILINHGVLMGVSYFENFCDVYNIGTDKIW